MAWPPATHQDVTDKIDTLDAALAALGLDGLADVVLGSPSDGEALVYDGVTGKWVAGVPAVGGKEIAYAENVTGVVTTATAPSGGASAAVDIPGCSITVPPNTGVVWLEGQAFLQQMVAGVGVASVNIIETTVGSGNPGLATDSRPTPNQTGVNGRSLGNLRPRYRVGQVASTRTFKLSMQVTGITGAAPSVQAANLSTFGGFASYLRAEAD